MYVTLTIDVEDFISPDADDAARDVAEIVAMEGLRATCCVVGEKARRLLSRRRDVIEALKLHDIGLHTDTHSLHPTTLEALEGLGYDEGVEVMVGRERPGVEAIRETFGMEPSCWGGAGNTWGPQVCGALRELGIPSYVYAHTAPPGCDPHRFDGVRAYGGGLYLGDATLHLEPQWRERLEALVVGLIERREAGGEWCEVFVCHPCRLRSEEFWDGANFAHGRQPAEADWVPARAKPEEEYTAVLAHLRQSLRALKEAPGLEFRTIREMNGLTERAEAAELNEEERARTERRIRDRLRHMKDWPIHRPDLKVDRIVDLTLERVHTIRKLRINSAVPKG